MTKVAVSTGHQPVGLIAPVCYGMEGNFVGRLAPADVTPVT